MSVKEQGLLDEAAGGESQAVKQGSSDVKKPEATGGSAAATIGGAGAGEGTIKQGSSDEKKPEGTPANGLTGKGGDGTIKQGSSDVKIPTSKVGMINHVVAMLNSLKRDELSAKLGKIAGAVNEEELAIEDETIAEEQTEDNTPRITSVDVSEDIAALFANDESLTEDFKDKATTIFEAAIVARVNEQLQKVTLNIEEEVQAERAKIHEDLAAKLDDYLDYVTEQWLEENRLAVEQGLKSEIVEDFIGGLKALFVEHYIDVPDEKEDVLEGLVQRSEELEAKLNEQIEETVELKKQIDAFKQAAVFAQVSESLTDTQKEKFKVLAESIDFNDEETYANKLSVIKESYFKGSAQMVTENHASFDDEPVEIDGEEKIVPAHMKAYLSAISRTVKK